MRLNDDVYVLALPVEFGGQASHLNVTLIVDPTLGPTLVDAGVPGQRDVIATALQEAGLRVEDLRRVILTHHDFDHIGSLNDIVEASGARVLALDVERPLIDGTETPRWARPEFLERAPQLRPIVEAVRPTPVDETLQDGSRLDLAGGTRAVATPGHTPGHMCLFLERTGTLITGDALVAEEGTLAGPNPQATPDTAEAVRSVRKLAELDVKAIVCYHGGVVDRDASAQLRKVAEDMES